MESIITTAGRTNISMIQTAKEIASLLKISYVERNKKSVEKIQQEHQANVMVVGKERLEYFPYGSLTPFFFHPNSAAFRMKRLIKGDKDPFLLATELSKGDKFLDTTAGLCSDSLIAAYAIGDTGIVNALEKDKIIAYMVQQGLKKYSTDFSILQHTMRQISICHDDALNFLKRAEDNSYDVVYMDPMFEEEIIESTNFQSLRDIGVHGGLSNEWVEQATRVARKRVVLKAHFRSPMFESFGFKQITRPTSKFHYGVIEK